MKTYTQTDVDAMVRDKNGYKHLPCGVYEDWINFGDRCIFPHGCTLGYFCTLGDGCTLGDRCMLRGDCTLGDGCTLGDECTLGNENKVGDRCEVGKWCFIGAMCIFGQNCTMEGGRVKDARYIKVGPIGSRNDDAYFYIDGDGKFFVRAGCFFGTENEFLAKVKETHAGSLHAVAYRAALDFAKTTLTIMQRSTQLPAR